MLASTIASVATIGVGVGIGVFGVNRAIEAVTGANYVAKTVFRENKPACNTTEAAFNIAGAGKAAFTAHRGVWPWNFGQNLDE